MTARRRLLPGVALLVAFSLPAAAQIAPKASNASAADDGAKSFTALTAVKLGFQPSPAVQVRINLLNAQGGHGEWVRRPNEEDALAYLATAAQGHKPKVVAHALKGMARSWSLRGEIGARINDDYIKVVRARLQKGPKRVRVAAFEAARQLLTKRPILKGVLSDVLAALEAPNSTIRFFAVRSLFNVSEFQVPKARKGRLKGKITAAVIPLLDDSKASVVAATADVLARVGFDSMPHRKKIIAKAKTLLTHPKAKVRGTALALWSTLAKKTERPALLNALRKGLTDDHGYVRGVAAEALSGLGNLAAIHELAALLKDKSKTALKLKKGQKYGPRLVLGARTGRQVRIVAMRGMSTLTKKQRSAFPKVHPKELFGRKLEKSIRRAETYYESEKKRFPTLVPPVATTAEKTGSSSPPQK